MQEKKFVKTFRIAKIIQFSVLLVIEAAFFIILICNPSMSRQLFSDHTLFVLCTATWILMLFSLFCILHDFLTLRSFAEESHALNKVAYLDNLTGIPNRHGLDTVFQTYDTPASLEKVGCFMVTLDNLKSTNETLGHQTGDMMLQHFSSILEDVGDDYGVVGRNGGNDFVLVCSNGTHEHMDSFIKSLNEQVAEYNKEHTIAPLRIAYTYILNEEKHFEVFTQLLTATYNQLHS